MPAPRAAALLFKGLGCPPGLQYLTMVDQLFEQSVEVLEAFTGFETKNKY